MQTFKELIRAKFVYKFKNTSSGTLAIWIKKSRLRKRTETHKQTVPKIL
jgi:hypothetical protein